MKFCLRQLTLLLIVSLTPIPLFAAETERMDEMVVTATRTETFLSQVASSVTVVTAEEIEARQQTQVIEVLRSVPGLSVVQSGSTGGGVSIYMRGTHNKHTLVLIDGVEFRDASGVDASASLSNLTTDNIERIEVVRGVQSVLYGSDAIGGVINIITKKGQKKPHFYASAEAGSYDTWRETAGGSLGNDYITGALSFSRTDTDGFSAADENNGNDEEDGYENTTFALNLNASPSDILELNLTLRSTEAEYEQDGFTDPDGDYVYEFSDTADTSETDEKTGRIEGVLHLLDDRWQMAVGAAYTGIDREYDYEDGSEYDYDGTVKKFDMQNTIRMNDQNKIVAGIETENEAYDGGDLKADATNNAAYLQDQFTAGHFSAAVGVRYDDHEEFGGETTWRVAPTYTMPSTGTRIKGSVGTGFKAPSVYQLYAPKLVVYGYTYYIGNEDLEPEESIGYDIGIEQPFLENRLVIGVAWFFNDIDNYIDYDYALGYQNIDEVKTQGIESTISWYPAECFDIQVGYTYTDTEDESGERLDRRPLHKGTADLNFYPIKNLQINLNALYTGERDDDDQTLDAYTLINLATSYQLTENLKIFGRVNNLFDEEYEEVSGYGTADISSYVGIKLNF